MVAGDFNLAFLTSEPSNGALGGLEGADARCQVAAEGGGAARHVRRVAGDALDHRDQPPRLAFNTGSSLCSLANRVYCVQAD